MCLMAHPDDCEILAGGTMALLADAGWEIHVASMTPGDCGTMDLGPDEIGRIRRAEGAEGAKTLGGTYHCLEARDLFVMFDEPTLRRTMNLMRSIAPTLVITHSLDDYMMDHEMTARLARTATFGYAAPNAAVGRIPEGARLPHLYYADPIEGVDYYGRSIAPTTWVDISSTITKKLNALKKHASQREWLMKHHGMDEYVDSTKSWSAKRGGEISTKYAEAFRQHRGHPYPHDCILERLFGDKVRHDDARHDKV